MISRNMDTHSVQISCGQDNVTKERKILLFVYIWPTISVTNNHP